MKFLRPVKLQFPTPLVKFQSVRLTNSEKKRGRMLKQTSPMRLGARKA
jgi:hypothetical protein